jgi:hypothetical protein
VKFDFYSNAGEGPDSTGLYTNGASPTVPAVNMTSSGVNLHSGDIFQLHMSYNGTNLAMTITDVSTENTFSQTFQNINIPGTVGGNTAYVGFTGGTGGLTAIQEIIGWSYVSGPVTTAQTATPVISPVSESVTSAVQVTMTDSTPGSSVYYTIDGTTPTTSSTKYSGPFTVNHSESVSAIAVAPTYANSAIATANYMIVAPDFSLTPASSELTIQLGGQGADVITIAPLNAAFGNAVQLSCTVTGPLPLPACSLSPTSVTPGTGSPTSILTITTPSVSARLVPSLDPHLTAYIYSAWLSLVFAGLSLFASPKKESGRYAWVCCFLVLVLMQAACGGGSSGGQNASQKYILTVTGASPTTALPTIQHSTQVTVTAP